MFSVKLTSTSYEVTTDSFWSSQQLKYLESIGGVQKGLAVYLPPVMASLHRLFHTFGKENFRGDPTLGARWAAESGFPIEKVAEHPNFAVTPYPYQVEGGEFLLNSPHRGGILCLSPGMGKTMTSITTVDIAEYKRILVVAPLILLPNWEAEIQKWSKMGLSITSFRGQKAPLPEEGWVLTNYEQLGKVTNKAVVLKPELNREWDLIIFDESIRLKSKDASRSKCAAALSPKAKKVWLLSGIPISRDVSDLWSQFRVIDKQFFRSFWRFAETYCVVWKAPWGDTISGTKPGLDMSKEFRDLIFVRNKGLLGLPPLIYDSVVLEMGDVQRRIYEKARKDYLLEIADMIDVPIIHHLTQLQRLQQIASSTANVNPEIEESVRVDYIVSQIEAEEIEFPCLIFGNWVNGMKHLERALSKVAPNQVGLITGDVPLEERQGMIEKYQRGELPILILSYSVGQYGLNLQMTKTLIFFDKVFGSEAHLQAKDRVDRIGRRFPCRILNLNLKGTIDDRIIDSLSDKFIDISNLTKLDIVNLLKGAGKE